MLLLQFIRLVQCGIFKKKYFPRTYIDTAFQLTAAGRRVLDLLENQWMTDETHGLSGNQLTVRGFHGVYEVLVVYQGRELGHLKQMFALGKRAHSVRIHVHT